MEDLKQIKEQLAKLRAQQESNLKAWAQVKLLKVAMKSEVQALGRDYVRLADAWSMDEDIGHLFLKRCDNRFDGFKALLDLADCASKSLSPILNDESLIGQIAVLQEKINVR
jgi:hypothetical protein